MALNVCLGSSGSDDPAEGGAALPLPLLRGAFSHGVPSKLMSATTLPSSSNFGFFFILFAQAIALVVVEMADHMMVRLHLEACRWYLLAYIHDIAASGMELAACRRIGGRGDAAFQNNPLHLDIGVRHRDGAEKSLRVRVQGIGENRFRAGIFDQAAQIHDADRVGYMFDDRKVVGNEQIGQVVLVLKVLEQVDDLCLYRDIQR